MQLTEFRLVPSIGRAFAVSLVVSLLTLDSMVKIWSAVFWNPSTEEPEHETHAVGSLGGVAAANRGECDIAPVHLIDPASGEYNVHLAKDGLALVQGWRRMQGILFRPADARFIGRSAEEALQAALADPSALMVNRNAGAGTRVLMDKLLNGVRPPGYANQPKSHNAVAAAIAQERADWGLAIEPVARLYGLGFIPVAPEHYDFLVVESRKARPAVQAFLAALADDNVREKIRALGMTPSAP